MTVAHSATAPRKRAVPPVVLIFAITATGIMGNSFISPALPDIKEAFGIGDRAIGLFVAAGSLPGMFLAPVMGVMADRFGRKAVLVPSLLLFGTGGMLAGLAPTFPLLIAARVIAGIGLAAPLGLAIVLIGDFWDGPERTRLVGLNAAVLTVFLALYPVIGGQVTASFGWRWSFAPFATAWVLALLIARLFPADGGRDATSVRRQFAMAARELRRPAVLALSITAFIIFALIFGLVLTTFPLLLEDSFGADAAVRGRVLAVGAAVSSVASLRLGWIRRRVSARTVSIVGLLASAVSYAIIGNGSTLLIVTLGTVFFGIGEGILIPTLQDLVTSSAPDASRGAVVSGFVSTIRAGQSVGPLAFGAMASTLGADVTFTVGAGILVVTAAVHAMLPAPYGLPRVVGGAVPADPTAAATPTGD